ncbi:hypothetical protein EON83_06650 [bacterium]|nr:MAG: hypothetical protein EON83_06650 [bacterium]
MNISNTKNRILWLGGVALFGCASLALAQTATLRANVVPQLAAFKVVSAATGDKLESAEKIAPGDIIEYQARYSNTGNRVAKNLQAILPIPSALQWVPSSALPANPQASLDGKSFASLPLKRTVKAPDGSEKVVIVPTSELRFLRWTITSLEPGQTVKVSARALLAQADKTTR